MGRRESKRDAFKLGHNPRNLGRILPGVSIPQISVSLPSLSLDCCFSGYHTPLLRFRNLVLLWPQNLIFLIPTAMTPQYSPRACSKLIKIYPELNYNSTHSSHKAPNIRFLRLIKKKGDTDLVQKWSNGDHMRFNHKKNALCHFSSAPATT